STAAESAHLAQRPQFREVGLLSPTKWLSVGSSGGRASGEESLRLSMAAKSTLAPTGASGTQQRRSTQWAGASGLLQPLGRNTRSLLRRSTLSSQRAESGGGGDYPVEYSVPS